MQDHIVLVLFVSSMQNTKFYILLFPSFKLIDGEFYKKAFCELYIIATFQYIPFSEAYFVSLKIYENSGETRSLEEMKISDSILLSLFIRDNKMCNIFHAP